MILTQKNILIILIISRILISCGGGLKSQTKDLDSANDDNFIVAAPGQIITGANLIVYDFLCPLVIVSTSLSFDCTVRFMVGETIVNSENLEGDLLAEAEQQTNSLNSFNLAEVEGDSISTVFESIIQQPYSIRVHNPGSLKLNKDHRMSALSPAINGNSVKSNNFYFMSPKFD